MTAPATPTASPLSDGEWHRMHPATPLLKGGLFALVIAGIVVSNLRERLIELFLPSGIRIPGADPIDYLVVNNLVIVALLGFLGVLVVVVLLLYLSWRFHSFRISGEVVEMRRGVVFRSHRRAPLDRVQGVNLTRPFLARLLGLATLEVLGGGTDGNLKLEYLPTRRAEQVRADILRLASGRRLAQREGTAPKDSLGERVSYAVSGILDGVDDEAPAESAVRIPVPRLILAHLVSPAMAWLVILVIATIVIATFTTPWILIGWLPALLGFGAYQVRSFLKALRYSIAATPDGVRVTFGLTTTVTEVIPPGRIHAVEISQSILWRGFGWWRIHINRITGRRADQGQADPFSLLLPVGTREEVERVLALVFPEMSHEQWQFLLEHGVLGPQRNDPFRTSPRRAWVFRILSWWRNGFLLTPEVLLLRRGVVWRKLALFPLARIQSFSMRQGPLERALRLGRIQVHTVAGPFHGELAGVDRAEIVPLFETVMAAAARAGAHDASHRWGERGGDAAEGPGYADFGMFTEAAAETAPERRPGPMDPSGSAGGELTHGGDPGEGDRPVLDEGSAEGESPAAGGDANRETGPRP